MGSRSPVRRTGEGGEDVHLIDVGKHLPPGMRFFGGKDGGRKADGTDGGIINRRIGGATVQKSGMPQRARIKRFIPFISSNHYVGPWACRK